jgi:hypothetical protein
MPKTGSSTDEVEFQAERGDHSVAARMNRSAAEVQRAELEAEGWAVEISDVIR